MEIVRLDSGVNGERAMVAVVLRLSGLRTLAPSVPLSTASLLFPKATPLRSGIATSLVTVPALSTKPRIPSLPLVMAVAFCVRVTSVAT